MSIATDTNVNRRWNLMVCERPSDGKLVVNLPPDLWLLILRISGIKSKRFRIQKKAVKRTFNRLLYQFHDDIVGK